LGENRCSRLGETPKTSAAISATSPKTLGETAAPNRPGKLLACSAPHDTSTNCIIRSSDPAASRSLDRCGADAFREPRARRHDNAPDVAEDQTA